MGVSNSVLYIEFRSGVFVIDRLIVICRSHGHTANLWEKSALVVQDQILI